jgi:hypothetical protein
MRLIDAVLLYLWVRWCNGLLSLSMSLVVAANKVAPFDKGRRSKVGLGLLLRGLLALGLIKASDLTHSFWNICHMAGRRSP